MTDDLKSAIVEAVELNVNEVIHVACRKLSYFYFLSRREEPDVEQMKLLLTEVGVGIVKIENYLDKLNELRQDAYEILDNMEKKND